MTKIRIAGWLSPWIMPVLLATGGGPSLLGQGPLPPVPVPAASQPAPTNSAAEQSDPWLISARQAAQQGLFPAAEASVRKFLSQYPSSATGHSLLGYILYLEVHPKESLAEYTLSAQHQTPSAVDFEIVALDYVLLGAFVDADRWLTQSLALVPDNAQGWYYLGRAKYNENRFVEAIEALHHCLAIDPRNVKAEDNIGLAEEGLNHPEAAATAFQTAISWQAQSTQKNAQPFLNLGSVMVDQGHAEQGLPYLKQAVSLAPKNPKAHEQLARAYTKLKQSKEAQRELESAVELAPNSSSLHFQLGIDYRDQGFKELAKREFDRCEALSATHSSIETPNQ